MRWMKGSWARQFVSSFIVLVLSLVTRHSSLITEVWADEPSNASLKAEVEVLKDRLARLEGKLARGGEAPVAVQPAAEIPEPVWPVPGIYTVPTTKDLGTLTGISWLSGTKIRGWVDTNYVVNFNGPDRRVVDANQGSSVVKGRDVSIEGRTFDIHDQSLGLSLAEVELEKVPELGGLGFKFDLAFGETQDIIVDTIKGSVAAPAATDSVSDFDKTFQHASLSYLAPIGRGLRFDAGKFVTHIGGETIETVKNWNYSHSFFYTYAIPFQDTGVHVSYPWSDTLYTDLYVLNGWNVTIDNNKGKTIGPSIGWTPVPWLSLVTNYLVGPERSGSADLRHLWDSQVMLGPFNGWNFMVNTDLAIDDNARVATVTRGTQKSAWGGVTGYARYKVNDWLEPSLRLEYYNDHHGFTTGLDQDLMGLTFTLNTKLGLGKSKGSVVLIRPEIRYDHSNKKFFTTGGNFRHSRDQTTVGVGATWLF